MAAHRKDYASLDEAVEQGEGVERPFRCHEHADSNASASVNVEKGVWYCHTCHAAGRLDHKRVTLTAEMKRTAARLAEDDESFSYPYSWLDWFCTESTHPYWEERFGADTVDAFHLGVHPITKNPTYPFHDSGGRLQGVVERSEGTPKYLYPYGVSAARALFNHVRGRHYANVLVCEGATDVMSVFDALVNHGLERMMIKQLLVVGCYGAGLHLPQVRHIEALSPERVILGFDNDSAGRRATSQSAQLLAGSSVPEVTSIVWDEKDPGECDGEKVAVAVTRSLKSSGPLRGSAER